MKELLSARGEALRDDDVSIERTVCHATSDYLYALSNKDFSDQWGGVDLLFRDLQFFIERWRVEEKASLDELAVSTEGFKLSTLYVFMEENKQSGGKHVDLIRSCYFEIIRLRAIAKERLIEKARKTIAEKNSKINELRAILAANYK